MVQYKLYYFNITALGEPLRMLLHYGGLPFEDVRVEKDDWPALKPSMPMGQMPVLEVDGKKVFQSTAIARYLGKLVGLAGKDDWENLQIDIMADTITDFRTKIGGVFYEEDEAVKARKLVELEKEILPFYLTKLDAIAKENNGHLAVGRLTWADVYFAGIWAYYDYLAKRDILATAPNLKAVIQNVLNQDKIKAYVASRPKTMEFE